MTISSDNHGDSIRTTYGKWFWTIIVIAITIGLFVVYRHRMDTVTNLANDALDYHNLALQLLREHTIDCYRAPTYPVLLAMIYAVFGYYLPAVYLVNVLLFIGTLVLVYKIAFYITRSDQTSLITIAICVIWPPFWMSIPVVLTETLSGFLVTALIWNVLVFAQDLKIVRCIYIGLWLVIATLTKAILMPYILMVVLYLAYVARKNRVVPIGAVVVLLISSICMGAWTVRNYKVTGEIIPVSTGGGFNFWLGNWPPIYHHVWEWKNYPLDLGKALHGKTEVEQDRILTRQAIGYMKEDPIRAIGLFFVKFSNLWLGGIGNDPASITNHVPTIRGYTVPKMSLLSIPLFVLSIVGFWQLPKNRRELAFPITILLWWWTAAYIITIATPVRYVLPVQAFEVMMAAVAISAGLRSTARLRSGRSRA